MTTITKNKEHEKLRLMSLTGLFAAIICLLTGYLHVPTGAGYTHIGDSGVFLAASMLPTPYAAAAAAIGAGLADGIGGFGVWIPATVVIKALTALLFTCKKDKLLCLRNLLALIPALVLCIVGYSLYQWLFMGAEIEAAFAQAPAYTVQIAASSAVYLAAASALDRSGLGRRFRG